jgi:alcohol dehydrogenase, propanol-preferring
MSTVPQTDVADAGVAKVEASGLCHTDIHAAHGDWPVKPSRRSSPVTRATGASLRSVPA